MFENVKAMCGSFLKMGVPYFDVIIYKDGKEILRYMDGYTDLENKIPVRGDEQIRMYSNSKPITVVAALRTYKLLKKETTDMIHKNWLTDEQHEKFGHKDNYFYGLGMRTAKPGTARADFGWGGAGGTMMNVDIDHGISVFYSQHLRSSPNQALRSRVYDALLRDLGYDLEVDIPNPEENKLTY